MKICGLEMIALQTNAGRNENLVMWVQVGRFDIREFPAIQSHYGAKLIDRLCQPLTIVFLSISRKT